MWNNLFLIDLIVRAIVQPLLLRCVHFWLEHLVVAQVSASILLSSIYCSPIGQWSGKALLIAAHDTALSVPAPHHVQRCNGAAGIHGSLLSQHTYTIDSLR